MRFGNRESINAEFEFQHGKNSYMVNVSFDIRTTGEYPSWDYPGDSESEIEDLKITFLTVWNEDLGDWIAISSNEEIDDIILDHLQRNYL